MSDLDELIRVSIVRVPEGSPAQWAEGAEFRLPRSLFDTSAPGSIVEGSAQLDLAGSEIAFSGALAESLRASRAFTERPPASARLPILYQRIPAWLRDVVASAIGRIKRRSVDQWARFPAWPLDLSADLLADLAGIRSPFAQGPTPVVLTHDLDSPEGLRNLEDGFLRLEEAVGARSSNYVVPCGWPLDHALLAQVAARGNEIGIHGYDHSNLTPFVPEADRQQRLGAAREMIERYGAFGYRAPSLLRTPALLRALRALYRYDSSIPTSGGLFPTPNNGCASARPFVIEGMLEIPVSMPRDGSLLFLGYAPEEILSLWMQCAERIAASGGVVVLLTHCERRFTGSAAMLNTYRRFLEHVAESPRFAFSNTSEIIARCAADRSGAPPAVAACP